MATRTLPPMSPAAATLLTALTASAALGAGVDGLADPAALTITGSASLGQGSLRLTPDKMWQAGSAFWQCPIRLDRETTIDVYLEVVIAGGREDGKGADGLAFVVQASASGPGAVGGKGGAIAFGGVAPALGVELDTWRNSKEPDDNHVALVSSELPGQHLLLGTPEVDLNGVSPSTRRAGSFTRLPRALRGRNSAAATRTGPHPAGLVRECKARPPPFDRSRVPCVSVVVAAPESRRSWMG